MWALTACFRAGEIYEGEGKYEEAIKLYRKVAKRFKGSKKGDYALKRIKELKKKLMGVIINLVVMQNEAFQRSD